MVVDSATTQYRVAFDVVQVACADGYRFLAPNMIALEIDDSLEVPSDLDTESLKALIAAGVISSYAPPNDVAHDLIAFDDLNLSDVCLITDDSSLAAAWRLGSALQRKGARVWTADTESWRSREDRVEGKAVLFVINHEPTSLPDIVFETIRRGAAVVWAGETADGLHVGPVLRTVNDARLYRKATDEWSSAQALYDLGFNSLWPLSLKRHCLDHSSETADAILSVLDLPSGYCWLVHEDRPALLWSYWDIEPALELEDYVWSKGIVKGLTITEDPLLGVHIGHCWTPCGANAYFEANGGKGTGKEAARRTTIGEAVERFSASQYVQGGLASLTKDRAVEQLRAANFHPQLAGPLREPTRFAIANDLVTGRMFGVPEALIPFPLSIEPESCIIPTTTGLAAFPDRSGAVERAAMEILERDDFYPAFLHQRPGMRLPLNSALLERPVVSLAAKVGSKQGKCWLITYASEAPIAIVHAFILDEKNGFMSRGTGSGPTYSAAANGALLEAVQVSYQHSAIASKDVVRGTDAIVVAAYADWCRPEVIQAITLYLDAQATDSPNATKLAPVGNVLQAICDYLATGDQQLLVLDLPCPVRGWSAVRALISGACCHQQPSHTAGGRKLFDSKFRFGVPV